MAWRGKAWLPISNETISYMSPPSTRGLPKVPDNQRPLQNVRPSVGMFSEGWDTVRNKRRRSRLYVESGKT
jgi:hypothetical protein